MCQASMLWVYVDVEVRRKPLSGALRNTTNSELLSLDFSVNAVPTDHPDEAIGINLNHCALLNSFIKLY